MAAARAPGFTAFGVSMVAPVIMALELMNKKEIPTGYSVIKNLVVSGIL